MRGSHRLLSIVVIVGASTAMPDRAAGQEEEPTPPEHATLPGTDLPAYDDPEAKRDVPNYDGRPDPGPDAGDALLWIPRTLLFPVHLFFEYVLRRPLEQALTVVEREQLVLFLYDLFTFGPGQKMGLVPTFFVNFGFQPSVGLFYFANDVGAEGNAVRGFVGFGGVDWWRVALSDRYQPTDRVALELQVEFLDRPDYLFHGLGFGVGRSDRARYAERKLSGFGRVEVRGWRRSRIEWQATVAHREFEESRFRDDRTIQEQIDQGRIDELPPGFVHGYTALTQRLTLDVDSRRDRPHLQHGLRAAGFVEQGLNLADAVDERWLKVGGTIGGYVDVGRSRTMGLNVYAGVVEPLGGGDVPFTELFTLGTDPLLMGGFLPGFLRDDSAVVGTFEYRYPIWVLLDGSFHASVGNVFDGAFDDFRFERLRLSVGLAFRSPDPDAPFTLAIAFGTEPFDQGAVPESFRFVVGTSPL